MLIKHIVHFSKNTLTICILKDEILWDVREAELPALNIRYWIRGFEDACDLHGHKYETIIEYLD